ncbi:MAG: YitT family protein [Bacilli bacterium]|nr:YitT family protein [Bacilli bacterium]
MATKIRKIKLKANIYNFLIITFALVLSAACYNMFLLQCNIVSGGTGGIATILKKTLGWDQSLTLLIQALIFVIISFIFLGKEKTFTSLYASLVYPVFVKLTEPLIEIVDFSVNDLFVIVIFAGILNGIANGLIYKTGYNSGGFSTLYQILNEKFKVSIPKISLIINVMIISVGGYFFGATTALYAMIYLYVESIVMNKVLLGISNNKAFYIITTEEQEISDYIMKTLGHGITCFGVKGGFVAKRKDALLTVIPTRDYYRVTEGIKMIDPKAFFVATDSYEVKGAD